MRKTQEKIKPLTEMWQWQQHGRCRGVDSSVFFHEDGERGRARALRIKQAKALCVACPVIRKCREHALAVGEGYGIWGGLSESELAAAIALREQDDQRPIAV